MLRRALGLGAAVGAAAALATGLGLLLFAIRVAEPGPPAPPGPGIAVLTGGPERVERGLALLAERPDARLLISGVGHAVVPADLGATGARITLGHTATSTRGNAREVAAWARDTGLRQITIVTAGFHMPRALLELRRALPDAAFQPHPVPPYLPRPTPLLREYGKLVGAALGLSALVDRPRGVEAPAALRPAPQAAQDGSAGPPNPEPSP
ncbi:YdcF family protein [Roseomonas sp. CCTCC AB2023176]|uniref:YdcF family protein n=1 Tax=Roseomonas sp. CCTCC AB2023176 TaxID=3342640 RepID=UPI0035E0266D